MARSTSLSTGRLKCATTPTQTCTTCSRSYSCIVGIRFRLRPIRIIITCSVMNNCKCRAYRMECMERRSKASKTSTHQTASTTTSTILWRKWCPIMRAKALNLEFQSCHNSISLAREVSVREGIIYWLNFRLMMTPKRGVWAISTRLAPRASSKTKT